MRRQSRNLSRRTRVFGGEPSGAFVYRLRLKAGERATHELAENRGIWGQEIEGSLRLNETPLQPGDGASAEERALYMFSDGDTPVEAFLFDLS
jgi:redox-sensitive bicupin YhaK (pirin superfamily)